MISPSALLLAGLAAADLEVYSEFRRVGPDGEILAADRGGPVREFLSPKVPRGGWVTYQVVVKAEPGTEFWLYTGQNPENSAKVKLWRAEPGGSLTPVESDHHDAIPAGAKARVYWLDLLYPATLKPQRLKLEPQLWLAAEKRWIVYPMEVNVVPAKVPVVIERVSGKATLEGRADDLELGLLRAWVCQGAEPPAPAAPVKTVADLLERNARQDIAFLRRVPRPVLPDKAEFCAPGYRAPNEWLLRLRDTLYRRAVE